MSLGFDQRENETCYDAMIRAAKPHGLDRKCAKVYQMEIGRGASAYMAAFEALRQYDLLEIVVDD
jgi:hypothetical protein